MTATSGSMPSNKSAFGQIKFSYYYTLLPHCARPCRNYLTWANVIFFTSDIERARAFATSNGVYLRGGLCHSEICYSPSSGIPMQVTAITTTKKRNKETLENEFEIRFRRSTVYILFQAPCHSRQKLGKTLSFSDSAGGRGNQIH